MEKVMRVDSTDEGSSKHDMISSWRGSVVMTDNVYFSRKRSTNFTCSVMVLCVKLSPVIMSKHRSDSMSRPEQNRYNKTLSGKDMSGPEWIKTENLAQAEPIDSFSYSSKSRIALGREKRRDLGKKRKRKLSFKLIPNPVCTFYGMSVPLLRLFIERIGKQFPP